MAYASQRQVDRGILLSSKSPTATEKQSPLLEEGFMVFNLSRKSPSAWEQPCPKLWDCLLLTNNRRSSFLRGWQSSGTPPTLWRKEARGLYGSEAMGSLGSAVLGVQRPPGSLHEIDKTWWNGRKMELDVRSSVGCLWYMASLSPGSPAAECKWKTQLIVLKEAAHVTLLAESLVCRG